MSKFSMFNDVESLIKAVPRTVLENIEFRMGFHSMLAKDKKLQKVFWNFCREDLQVLFDTTFWTLNPRKPWGQQNQPFILRPQQVPVVHRINENIRTGRDTGINKTRDEGASEICAKIFSAWTMLYERVSFILGSDKKEDVDNIGNDYTLFAKVDNVFNNLPSWMDFKYETDGGCVKRKDMLLRVKRNNSAIIGETTNENFSAGSRATAMVLDEFGRIRKSVADSIEGTVHAVTNCVIYSSTHWLGQNHTFNVCLNKTTTDTVELLWYQNPEKAEGLYESPAKGRIKLVDTLYYNHKMSGLMQYCDANGEFELQSVPEEYRDKFVADGKEDPVVICRSPWHDYKEVQSKGNKRDFYCNVWATPLGSADTVFDPSVLHKIKTSAVRPPNFTGEVIFDFDSDDNIVNQEFVPNLGKRRLQWWGNLINYSRDENGKPLYRPDQRHNYIMGIDPGQGLGSSNSVAYIYDVNTHEMVGEWVCAYTKPEAFADMCVAIAYWCGGVEPTFLIWERNGGHGTSFTERVKYLGYWHCYTMTVEDAKTRKRKDKLGFFSNTERKAALLLEFGIALGYALDGNRRYVCAFIYSIELVDELFDYVFVGEGKEIRTSSKADLSSGAYERHGDRAIAASLCILGTRDQLPGENYEEKHAPYGSFEFHRQHFEAEQKKDKRKGKKYLF